LPRARRLFDYRPIEWQKVSRNFKFENTRVKMIRTNCRAYTTVRAGSLYLRIYHRSDEIFLINKRFGRLRFHLIQRLVKNFSTSVRFQQYTLFQQYTFLSRIIVPFHSDPWTLIFGHPTKALQKLQRSNPTFRLLRGYTIHE